MKHRPAKVSVRPNGDQTEVEVIEYVPTEDDMQLLFTNPILSAAARDICGDGSLEYKHNSPLAIWKSFPVTYYSDNSLSSALRTGVMQSFDVYNGLKPGFFQMTSSSTSAKIIIKMGSIDSAGQTLARANWSYSTSSLTLTKGSITFDSNEQWGNLTNESCGSNGSIYDIRNIAVHEIGHLVGLSHAPTDTLQTMYATTAPGKTIGRTLGNGDIEGIRKAYNLPITPPTPEPVEIEIIMNNIKGMLEKQKLKLSEAESARYNLESLVAQLEDTME